LFAPSRKENKPVKDLSATVATINEIIDPAIAEGVSEDKLLNFLMRTSDTILLSQTLKQMAPDGLFQIV
jgi:hypothetical protein